MIPCSQGYEPWLDVVDSVLLTMYELRKGCFLDIKLNI